MSSCSSHAADRDARLGARPPLQNTLASEPAQSFQAPDWTIGYYATLWTPDISRTNGGDESTLGVQFTGEWLVMPALTALGIKSEECDATDKSWCDGQVTYAESLAKSTDEARKQTIEDVDSCVKCLMTAEDKTTMAPPFSAKAKNPKHRGAQYLSLGGGANAPAWEIAALSDFVEEAPRSPRSRMRGLRECASTSRGQKGAWTSSTISNVRSQY